MSYRSNQNPMFRSKFSEDIFNNKYAHYGCETWEQLAKVLVSDVCGDYTVYMSMDEQAQLANYITNLKFIPGGRYLYYAGRPNKFFNNCLNKDTRIVTRSGMQALGDIVNTKQWILSPVDGEWKLADIVDHGVQPINKITFAPVRGRSSITYQIKATPNHRWPLMDDSVTSDLKVGDVVKANTKSLDSNDLAFAHGFVYGDGTRQGQVRICSDNKLANLDRLSKVAHSVTYPDFADGDPCLYFNQKIDWKSLPVNESPDYIASFIEGWIAADGHDDRQLSCVDEAALEWFRDNAVFAGIVISGNLRKQVRDVHIGNSTYRNHSIYFQNYSRGSSWQGFKVVAIDPAGEENVYCPREPQYERFVLENNIDTFNCYLLKAEEDSREDWANLSWKAESCLMTGGGIGVDYTVYREEGALIKKTGGYASGPIPKMNMVNEIGRRVMQGGSRRSAIYASLNWKHPDSGQFLKAKDWKNMPVGTTGYSYWDIKQQDFNFAAPLDMTNISLNYDTSWLLDYWSTGDVGDTFRQNVYQALSTSEPGFSFNFFDKENETLRNACTEVTSEDDSDVCNLGSINVGRVDDIEEFQDIVDLATKFLICGTLRAHLPYKKIEEVRAKNRRLGLGLMGLHEWLLKRGSKYEVTEELHQWLSVYRGQSDKTSKSFADNLSVSRPVANRAIAPTGSIGILAGTTTGIEPIFAVAYKRRYLTEGTKWKYQYVVDGTAQELIDVYGLNPDQIESAMDLAKEPERRIKFQADIQDYVDMSISSTINLPEWGTEYNNPDKVEDFANTLAKYAHRLRGFTAYADGSRGGQPLVAVPYSEAVKKLGEEFEESVQSHDICDISGKGGSCGI